MTKPELEEIVMHFARDVIAQTAAIRRGDSKTGNKHAKRYIEGFRRLRDAGDIGREALAELFRHERPEVRAMAATFLLRYRTDEAKAVLTAVAETGEGLEAFGAEQALKRWEEGTWALDPEK